MTSLWQATAPRPETDPWEPGARCDVLVVGAGLTGLATAHTLVRQGLDVVVLEARRVGGAATARTTGQISLLQGTTLSGIRRRGGMEAVQRYVDASRAGSRWWLDVIGEGAALQRRPALTYTTTEEGKRSLAQEWEAATDAGLLVEAVGADTMEFAVPAVAVLRLSDQLQAHPLIALEQLTREIRAGGGLVVEGVRLTGLQGGQPHVARTDHGPILAETVVLATGTPVLDQDTDRGRTEPPGAPALSYRLSGGAPTQGMYLSADDPTRSVRSVPVDGDEFLVVGGTSHVVDREPHVLAQVEDLRRWTQDVFPGAQEVHSWWAQDYRSEDGIPAVGPLAGADPAVLCASGAGTLGLANRAAAALALAGWVTGEVPSWA